MGRKHLLHRHQSHTIHHCDAFGHEHGDHKHATLTPKNPLKVEVYFTVNNGTSTAVKGNVTVTASSGETCGRRLPAESAY